MGLLEWVGIGVIMLVAGVLSVRIMRRGLPTYAEDREKYLQHMDQMRREVEEDRKHISAREQMYLMHSALDDFVRLERLDAQVVERGNVLCLKAGDVIWQIDLLMRERMLASSKRVIHGQSRWLLTGPNVKEEYLDCARLMASLNAHWHGCIPDTATPEHVARRLAHGRRVARRKK